MYKKTTTIGHYTITEDEVVLMSDINGRGRKVYIDFLKIIAIYLVLFNHTGKRGFVLFTISRDSPLFHVYLFNAVLIKIAVPLFFMTSGALLLGKEETIKKVVCSRFLKYLTVLMAGSVIQYLYTCLVHKSQPLSVSTFFTRLYTSNFCAAYWYLYAYLAYILMLPLLRCLARAMTEREYLWMFLMYGLINFLSIIEFLIWKGDKAHNISFDFFITTSYVFYPLMGYYIDRKMSEKINTWKTVLLMSVISIAAICLCCHMTIYRCSLIGEWKEGSCQTFFNTLIFLPSTTVYLCIKKLFEEFRPKEKICRMISSVSGLTFGIYLIEKICRIGTSPVFLLLNPYIRTLPACWIWIFVSCLAGGIITAIVKLIPPINKFI